jgi:Nitrate and nitrite sensing/HAMP domain
MIRDMPIRTKLFAILITPLIAMTILASVGIGTSLARNVQAERLTVEATFAVNLAQLVHELQRERDLSAAWVAGNSAAKPDALGDQRAVVNKTLASFRKNAQGLEAQESPFDDKVALALRELNKLRNLRLELDELPGATVSTTLDSYSGIINQLLAVSHEIAGVTDDRSLLSRVASFAALTRLKEATSLERGLLNAVSTAGRFDPGGFQTLAKIVGAQENSRSFFDATATPEQRAALRQALESPEAREASRLRNSVLIAGDQGPVDLDPSQWYRSMTVKVDRLRQLEEQVLADLSTGSEAAQSSASRQALLFTIILTMVLWLTVGLSILMARSMVRPLQILTRTANEVAEERLPNVVERLQHTKDARDLNVVPEPIPVRSKDEIGQVSTAFNSVHQVAIEVATEQAALRRSIGDMFTNLARRSQTLIDRQLELIEDLERTETNPETLENLFRLDHMATRMRRNAEDLIVLSHAEPGRHWVQPMTVLDVVRAAAAEVEQYQRVEFLPMVDVQVAGHAAVDVIHLLAELIENATSFSPPNTKVQIAGQAVPHGYVVEIEDRGLGMSDEELIQANERLADPPEIDFALSRVLGLYVVGRLAKRHGIKVQLRHSWYGGVTALTLLPHGLLTWPKMTQAAVPEPVAVAAQAELPSPERSSEPEPAFSSEHLPIFEAARSDWFVTEPPTLHRHRQRTATADGAPPTPSHRPPSPSPVQEQPASARADAAAPVPPVVEQPLPYRPEPARADDEEAPPYQAERTALGNEPPSHPPAPASAAEAAPPPPVAVPPAPDSGSRTTRAGLPRRVPRANMAPGMVDSGQTEGQPPPGQASGRTPDEVRAMLSSYRSGIERGRTVAGNPDQGDRPPENP